MYVSRPEFADSLADFVRSRPARPLDAFLAQAEAAWRTTPARSWARSAFPRCNRATLDFLLRNRSGRDAGAGAHVPVSVADNA
jgi:hypothetical protein